MIDQEWIKFSNTGSIQDYLSYKSRQEAESACADADACMLAGSNGLDRSVKGYGADHSADGHGIISSSGGGI